MRPPNLSRNSSADMIANHSVGGSGAMLYSSSHGGIVNAPEKARKRERASSAYRDDVALDSGNHLATGGGLQAAPVNDAMCEIDAAELRDLQTTVQINKDIIKSLIEAQQAKSPTHSALKYSLQALNEENRVLQQRLREASSSGPKTAGIVIVDKEAQEK